MSLWRLIGSLRWLLVALLLFEFTSLSTAGSLFKPNIGDEPLPVQIEILDSNFRVQNTDDEDRIFSEENSLYLRINGIPNLENLHVRLKINTETNQSKQSIDTVDKNGNHHRFSEFNGPESSIFKSSNFFTAVGTVLNSDFDSNLFVIGYDNKRGSIRLTAFVTIENVRFYLRPSPFHSPNSIDPNLHLISVENQFEEYLNFKANQILENNLLQRIRRTTYGKSNSYVNSKYRYKEHNSCGIKLIVDYSFYLKMDKDIGKVMLLVNYAMFIANQVFRNTVFTKSGYATDELNDDSYTGYGLILCKVVIHQHEDDQIPYNRAVTWKFKQLTSVLEKSLTEKSGYCLVHLFTNNRIENSYGSQINGLASIGKIFTEHNVGATSFDAYHSYQLSGIMNFVHEVGHNFGALHDPESSATLSPDYVIGENCLPEIGGVFIMSSKIFLINGRNNFFLSPCSIRSIWKTIKDNLNNFIEIDGCKSCGNNILEEDEECDDSGPCCDKKTCRLKKGVSCSPVHSVCCDSNCQFKPNKTICAPKDLEFCLEEVLCDGVSALCPNDRDTMPNGTRCNINEKKDGTCLDGFCRFTCPDDYQKCKCDSQYPCRVCCSPVGTFSHCFPMLKLANDLIVSNGTHHGKCFDGEFVYHDEPTFITDQITPAPPTTVPYRPDDKDLYFKYVFYFLFVATSIALVAKSCLILYSIYRNEQYVVTESPRTGLRRCFSIFITNLFTNNSNRHKPQDAHQQEEVATYLTNGDESS